MSGTQPALVLEPHLAEHSLRKLQEVDAAALEKRQAAREAVIQHIASLKASRLALLFITPSINMLAGWFQLSVKASVHYKRKVVGMRKFVCHVKSHLKLSALR